ncbi:MAG: hypothetical protein CL928_00565 [Deltaproteobacteria bacterium]|nr:hypothetical protein [Deltaproteobacteria bacterium]
MASDLGPVPFSIKVILKPRVEAGGDANRDSLGDRAEDDLRDGFFSELQSLHGSLFEGNWRLHFGPVKVSLKLPEDLDYLEEFWVFLLELVDAGYGEWTLDDEGDPLILEAQVFGPDVQLEFGAEKGSPSFRGVALPRRALVRLRAVVDEGTGFVSSLVEAVRRADSRFQAPAEADQILSDLEVLRGAVASYPAAFRPRGAASPSSAAGRLEVLDS